MRGRELVRCNEMKNFWNVFMCSFYIFGAAINFTVFVQKANVPISEGTTADNVWIAVYVVMIIGLTSLALAHGKEYLQTK